MLRRVLARRVSARDLFRSGNTAPPTDGSDNDASSRRPLWSSLRHFYADPLGWVAVGLCSLVVAYGGGAVMFWFHSVLLGEGGPAISPWLHWLMDSTAGFLSLTPAIAVLIPLAAVLASAEPASDGPSVDGRLEARTMTPFRVGLLSGGMLAVLTAPAPILHDELIGRGTWMADQITEWWGNGRHPTGEAQGASRLVEAMQQVAIGAPTYVLLLWLCLAVVRRLTRSRTAT